MNEISEFLKKLKFKKQMFNGLDEADVWHKIELLQVEYEKSLKALETKYEILLADRQERINLLEDRLKNE